MNDLRVQDDKKFRLQNAGGSLGSGLANFRARRAKNSWLHCLGKGGPGELPMQVDEPLSLIFEKYAEQQQKANGPEMSKSNLTFIIKRMEEQIPQTINSVNMALISQ